jgi:nitrite reductase/ring-hydroxylating ferredoxin subunit
MKFETGWYPVALSETLEPGTSAGTRIFGKEIVVWRDLDGDAHVWEDRCPHRGMRFSFGFVRGNSIACLYHGWHYDRAGQCHYIPAHPNLDVPKTIRANVYSSAERLGMLWVYSEPVENPPALSVEEAGVTPVRSVYVDCDAASAAAALAEAELPPFKAKGASLSCSTSADGPLFTLVAETAGGRDVVIVGVQPVADASTALHIVVADGDDAYRGAGQKHFARWAEALRRAIERRAAPSVVPALEPAE